MTPCIPRLTLATGVATFLVVASAYFATLFRGIPGGDSGELVAEACHLGVAHPPGYPLYTLLGHVMVRLFGGARGGVSYEAAFNSSIQGQTLNFQCMSGGWQVREIRVNLDPVLSQPGVVFLYLCNDP